MNENENTETGSRNTMAKPGKFWLWGLAVIQLPAVMMMTWVGIEETVVKLAGFAILLLCGSMDIKAVKKAGCPVPRWWWGLAVFLPPVYMVCRVVKTDKAPSDRVKRFAPVLVWVLLLLCLVGLMGAMAPDADADVDLNAAAAQIMKEALAEHFGEAGVGDYLEVGAISNVSLLHQYGNKYTGIADVQLKTSQGTPSAEMVRYDLEGTFDGDQLMLEFVPLDSHAHKIDDLLEKAGYSEE